MLDAVLLNIISQAIWELGLSPLLRGDHRPVSYNDPAEDEEAQEEARYSATVEHTLQRLKSTEGTTLTEKQIIELLSSREVRTLVVSLFIFRLDWEGQGVKQAHEEFLALSSRQGISRGDADRIFTALVQAAEASVNIAISDKMLSPRESGSAARQQLILQHLDAMERRTRYLTEEAPSTPAQVDNFEKDLRREVMFRHSTITPPDFYGSQPVAIDDLYVEPDLELPNQGSDDASEGSGDSKTKRVTVKEWLASLGYGIVLGNPGAGKSTLATKICHALSSNPSWTVGGQQQTPVMVTLRDYSTVSRERGLSISEYIADTAKVRYQLNVPPGAIDYLLLAGRLMVIFDGLDELLETHRRQEVRDDVESFQRRFPSARLLITSRVVGYAQAPLNHNVFDRAQLPEFRDEQVEEYAAKWFRRDSTLSQPEQEEKARAFVTESEKVAADLRGNPLLLALLCNLYRGQNYLPRHRPEVYESCARMLFETWDRSRGIEGILPIAEHIRPAVRFLAWWIYEDETRQSGVLEEELIDKAVEFLLEFRFEDPHEARAAAESFIEFCAGRAWVFSDIGTTPEGVRRFQFTHRTFLEYFAADHLVAISETTAELSERLVARIAAREGIVVAQIAFQLKSKSTLTAANQLLDDLIRNTQDKWPAFQANLLLFGAECLAFIVPAPQVVRRLGERIGELFIATAKSSHDQVSASLRDLPLALTKAGVETRSGVLAGVVDCLEAAIFEGGEDGAAAALCFGELGPNSALPDDASTLWRVAMKDGLEATQENRRVLAAQTAELALSMARDEELLIGPLVEMHGLEALFAEPRAALRPNASCIPILLRMVDEVLNHLPTQDSGANRWLSMLEEVAVALRESPPPWAQAPKLHIHPLNGGCKSDAQDAMSPEAKWGVALVFACYAESLASGHGASSPLGAVGLLEMLNKGSNPVMSQIEPIIRRRLIPPEVDPEGVVEKLRLGSAESNLLESWMERRRDFLRVAKTR